MTNHPILVVDDEAVNLAAMEGILSDHYPLVFARNGEEALVAAIKHHPALILLDVELPDMDGFAVCRLLKSDPRTVDTPVIFVTSLSEVGNEKSGFMAGAVDYITKPVVPEIVIARVMTHMSLVKAHLLEQSYKDAIYMLGESGHYNDSETGVHIWRMASYARVLAIACGWSVEDADRLELAAPMHDMGKIGIPQSILSKPAKLDEQEWKVMKLHSQIGHDILAKSKAPLFQLAAQVALRHHERWDGSGYPDGLAGEAIPQSARIVAVADVFDALTTKRPYKEMWSIDRTIAALEESKGSHFEPRLVELFVSILPQILEIKAEWDAREALNE